MRTIVTARNHKDAKEQFRQKFSPGYRAHWTRVYAHVWQPGIMRSVRKDIPDSVISFEVHGYFRYDFEEV